MTIGSLFSGIGGIDLGFQQAGFDILWAIEKNHASCETYRENLKTISLIKQDIRDVDASKLPAVEGIVAGFPCQAFSVGGNQNGFKDHRGNLYFEVIRFVEKHKPRFVFLENVANLLDHDSGRTFLTIYTSLNALGYCLRYRVMRASDYGNVPQIRDRIYIVAFKSISDCDCFCFPEPLKLQLTVDAIIDRGKPVRQMYYCRDDSAFSKKARAIVVDRSKVYRVYRDSIKAIANGLCPTLTASMGAQRNQVPLIMDDYGVRKITPNECLKFQGFPSEFYFPNTITIDDAYKQVGNSVCVPVIRRIAEKIKEVM